MFGRDRAHKEISPTTYRWATIGVYVFSGLVMLLILTSLVAAFRG